MLGKLAVFGIGYLLGSRAGRERYEELTRWARRAITSEEVATAVGYARGTLWIARQGVSSVGRRLGAP